MSRGVLTRIGRCWASMRSSNGALVRRRRLAPHPGWACSAAGSAPEWHSGGHRFDPGQVHQPSLTCATLRHLLGELRLASQIPSPAGNQWVTNCGGSPASVILPVSDCFELSQWAAVAEARTIGSINGVSAAAVNGTPAIRHGERRSEEPLRRPARQAQRLIIARSTDGSSKKSTQGASWATGGRTSGESAPGCTDQWHGTKPGMFVSSSNEQGATRGGARPGLGVGTSVGRRRWRRMRSRMTRCTLMPHE